MEVFLDLRIFGLRGTLGFRVFESWGDLGFSKGEFRIIWDLMGIFEFPGISVPVAELPRLAGFWDSERDLGIHGISGI